MSAAGAAAINHQLGTVQITIAGNNDPHGVFQFASSSLAVDTAENANVTLQVIRKFGAFGKYDNADSTINIAIVMLCYSGLLHI